MDIPLPAPVQGSCYAAKQALRGVPEKRAQPSIQEAPEIMPKKDRRAIQRFLAKPDDRIIYDERSSPVRDVSMEGVFVLDPDPLPVGSEIVFIFRAGRQDISLEGYVRHSVDGEGMGIHLTKISPVSKRRLIIHIASLVPAPIYMEIV